MKKKNEIGFSTKAIHARVVKTIEHYNKGELLLCM